MAYTDTTSSLPQLLVTPASCSPLTSYRCPPSKLLLVLCCEQEPSCFLVCLIMATQLCWLFYRN